MQKYELNSRDMKNLESVINVATSIYLLYERLYKLESEGKKNTTEYMKNVDYLKLAIEVEEQQYNKYFPSQLKIRAVLDFLVEQYDIEYIMSIDSLYSTDNYNLILRRVMGRLDDRYDFDITNLLEYMPDNLIDQLDAVGGDYKLLIDEETLEGSKNEIEMGSLLNNRIEQLFLINLQQNVENKQYRKMKQTLLRAKYDLIYLSSDLEIDLLYKNFSIPPIKPTFEDPSLFPDLDNGGFEDYTEYKNEVGLNICGSLISEMLDYGYNNKTVDEVAYTDLLLKQIYLKSYLPVLNEEYNSIIRLDTKDKIWNYEDEAKQYNTNRSNNISKKLVLQALRKKKQDTTNSKKL